MFGFDMRGGPMLNSIVTADADLYQSIFRMLLAPLSWIPVMQRWLLNFFLSSSSDWVAEWTCTLLLLRVLLFVAAIWCPPLPLYPIPSRSARGPVARVTVRSWRDA